MATSTAEDSLAATVRDRISSQGFKQWYLERRLEQDHLAGHAWARGPAPEKAPDVHTPSGLLRCHRRAFYDRRNAPVEGTPPTGLFWFGNRFEQDVVVPYLQAAVTDADTYVQQSLWFDTTIEVDETELALRGSTDPVIVTQSGEPILVTEIKTTRSVAELDAPRAHHRAQLHAYLYGLSAEFDRALTEGVIIYGDRQSFAVRAFDVTFDRDFWEETVLAWMADQTGFETADSLPPAAPRFPWECEICDFRHRCGAASTPYVDAGPTGLLPRFDAYERESLIEYLEAGENRTLTPTLAHAYPKLAVQYAVSDWRCPGCASAYPWDDLEWDGDLTDLPTCPACAADGEYIPVGGPAPGEQGQ